MNKRVWVWLGTIIGGLVVLLVGLWLFVLASTQPLENPLATTFPWPIACTVRGCVTTKAWAHQQKIAATFAASFSQEPASPASTLTTVIRQKLVADATLKSPVTLADAQKYRQEVLHLADDATFTQRTGLTSTQYDTDLVVPFLKQEALGQQRHAETSEDLFQQLAAERWVIVLPWHWHWDKTTGTAQPNQSAP